MSLHIVDYIILIVSLCSSFSIGLYFACAKDKNKTPDDYLVAGRSMNLIPVTISFIVSFFSAISMLGNASEIYYYGIEVWFAVFGWCASLSLNAAIMVPLFHPLKLTSVHHVSMIILCYMASVHHASMIILCYMTSFHHVSIIILCYMTSLHHLSMIILCLNILMMSSYCLYSAL